MKALCTFVVCCVRACVISRFAVCAYDYAVRGVHMYDFAVRGVHIYDFAVRGVHMYDFAVRAVHNVMYNFI